MNKYFSSIFLVVFLLFYSFMDLYSSNKSFSWGEPTNLNVLNTKADDFAPSLYNDSMLVFNSDISGKSIFYVSNITNDGSISEAKIFNSKINNTNINQSYVAFSNRGEAYLSKYKNYIKQSHLNIYKSIRTKNSWSEPMPVDSIAFEGFCSHPTISPDGNTLIFSSNRGNDDGTTNLWMVYRNDNGFWGTPFLVDELNSYGNEITPFLLSNDTLIFASDGYEGLGGTDLYYSVRSGNIWNRPFPLNDFNTEFNESDLIILPDRRAVFASDRPNGMGKLDLYIATPIDDNIISKSDGTNPEIIIKTQIENLIVQKNSRVRRFPSFHFLHKKFFLSNIRKSKYVLDSLMNIYPNILANFLRDNLDEKLVIDSSEINNLVLSYFESKGINSNRIKFQDTAGDTEFLKCRLFSKNDLPILEYPTVDYDCKPPVIEVSVESRGDVEIKHHELNLITNFNKYKYEINDNIVPFRDIMSIDDNLDELFNSDSIVVNYKFVDKNNDSYVQNRTINVSRQQLKENFIDTVANNPYEVFYWIIPEEISASDLCFSPDYIDQIYYSLNSSNIVVITYYDKSIKSRIGKIKNLITKRLGAKKIRFEEKYSNYKENDIFSSDLAPLLLEISVKLN